jgi:hypothetical protein
VKARLHEYAAVWDGLWPINRRRDSVRPLGLGHVRAVERVEALPALAEEHRRDVPVGGEAGTSASPISAEGP